MTTTNTTVFKRIGNMFSLIFSDYYEARVFRSSFMRLVTYAVLFIIGYRLNLVFDNVPNGRIFDGYAMAALFCGFSVLSGFMNNMICIGGCLTMLIFIAIKLHHSPAHQCCVQFVQHRESGCSSRKEKFFLSKWGVINHYIYRKTIKQPNFWR